MLDDLYTVFDDVVDKHDVYKVSNCILRVLHGGPLSQSETATKHELELPRGY